MNEDCEEDEKGEGNIGMGEEEEEEEGYWEGGRGREEID